MKQKDNMLQHVIHIIGDGRRTQFWLDPWLPGGRLLDRFGRRPIYDLGLGDQLLVADFICDGHRALPSPTSTELMSFWDPIQSVPLYPFPAEDEILWLQFESGKCSTTSAYKSLTPSLNRVSWASDIWCPAFIPKFACRAWLAIQNRLKTRELLLRFGMQIDPSCVLCSAPLENSNHLFFNCHYSQWIWFSILEKLKIQSQQLPSITEYLEQMKQSKPGKSVAAEAARIAFAAAISLIWKERNCRLFQNSANSKEYILHLILATVRNRILLISSQIRVPTASSFLARWDLPEPAQLPVIVAPTPPIHMAFGNAPSENPLRVIALTCLSASGACLALLTFGYNGYVINGLVISIAGSSRPQRELTAAVQALKFASGFSHLSIIMLSSSSPPAALILRQQTE